MSDRVFYTVLIVFVVSCLALTAYSIQKQSVHQQMCESKGGLLLKSMDGYVCADRSVVL